MMREREFEMIDHESGDIEGNPDDEDDAIKN